MANNLRLAYNIIGALVNDKENPFALPRQESCKHSSSRIINASRPRLIVYSDQTSRHQLITRVATSLCC